MNENEDNNRIKVKGKQETCKFSSPERDSQNDYYIQPESTNQEYSDFFVVSIHADLEKKIYKDGNISIWMSYIIDDDIEYLVNERLKSLKKVAIGRIDCLWSCLYNYLTKSNTKTDEYKDFHQLKSAFYLKCESLKKEKEDLDHVAMKYFANQYKMQLRFSSIDESLKEIIYGRNLLKSVHFLHIGLDLFLPLELNECKDHYKFSNEEKTKLGELTNINEKKIEDKLKFKNEVKTLKNLNKLLKGLTRADSYDFESMKRRGLQYDVYTPKQLDEMKDKLILCKLKINKSQSGLAIPIENLANKKFKEIILTSRQNCGFNVFLNDIVYVKIINEKFHSGKVMGVYQSFHKPVNKLYVCKVSKDQGNLMVPLDKSFPKIHVENTAGRNLYKNKIKNENKTISTEQESFLDKEKNRNSYADNTYFSLFDITGINQLTNMPIFGNCRCIEFSPDTCEYLFVVLYQKWNPHFMYPYGRIVGTLSSQDSLQDSLPLIRAICNLNLLEISPKYEKEVKTIREKHMILDKPHITLPSGAIVFTIDNKTTKDMDDAISYHREMNQIVIGVHISDVTKYVSPTSEMYKQAKDCFCTSYPPKYLNIPPYHIFDEKLATDFLSLVPGKPRAVVSVLFKFSENMINDKNFKLSDIVQPEFREDVIISKYKLNYEEVSLWLKQSDDPANVDADLYMALESVYKIARKIRHARLPYSYFVRSVKNCYTNLQTENRFEAELLIEEFMLLANEYVARIIYEKYPNSTLLRMQSPVKNREEWLENLHESTNLNFAGQLKEYCNLLGVLNFNRNSRQKFIVSRKFFELFNEFIKQSDFDKAKCLLQYDEYFNEFYVHITDWYHISNPSYYNCSEKDSVNMGHFSLNKSLYTHFTSPIRRFTDVVVHRLLKSVIDKIDIDDCSLDIDEICVNANTKSKYNKNFEKLCEPYAIVEETNKRFCLILDCVCSEINDEEIICAHPLLQVASSDNRIKFANLSLDEVPVLSKSNENFGKCNLKWRKIIFSCPPYLNSSSSNDNKFKIDSHLFDSYLPYSDSKLFQEIRRSYLSGEALENKLNQLCTKFVSYNYSNIISSDSFSFVEPIVDIELDMCVKNTMRIQFCKYKASGLMQINPELFVVTPSFHICLIHQNNPSKFFISGGKLDLLHNNVKESFSSIKEYKDYFEPLIEDESLMEALSDRSAFTLEKVLIKWILGKSIKTKKTERYGVITLSSDFCNLRSDIFHKEIYKIFNRYEYLIASGISSVGGDLLCLRCRKEDWNNYWVGHGHVVTINKCMINNQKMKLIIFRLTQSNFDLPKSAENVNFTLDIYQKSIVSIRQQVIMNKIDKIELLKEVILGAETNKKINNPTEKIIAQIENELNWKKFNRNQYNAVKNALNQKLSLIWGPPGTGKTMVGCYLSFAYTFVNRKENKNSVVLYCGPSNDCINLVASTMMEKFNEKCPKLLRIFGKEQEVSDFPIPGHFFKNKTLPIDIQEVSLHFLIRKNGGYADELKKFDNIFKCIRNKDPIPPDFNVYNAILTYKNLVKKAKKEYIVNNKFDMILCTTSVTLKQVVTFFNIAQVIIDEAGMCKEPETLIPIAAAAKSVKNVVLIGDHKQLRPMIRSRLADKRGLQISLFERYQKLKPELVTMLNLQYRMHPSICDFPSMEFYSGKLITHVSPLWCGLKSDHMKVFCHSSDSSKKKEEVYINWNGIDYEKSVDHYKEFLKTSNYNAIPDAKWPGKRKRPFQCFHKRFEEYPERIIFIDVIGEEISQSVTTTTGNEKSKGNKVEVEVVGYIYKKLLETCFPPRLAPNFITVLTQYSYQQHLLEMECKSILLKKTTTSPIVKTVIRSQGSENDYVIFSTVRSMNIEDINYNPTFGWEQKHLGFITNLNQINVALTRAKKGLIIIGNKRLLKVNQTWKKLIENLEERNCVIADYLNFI